MATITRAEPSIKKQRALVYGFAIEHDLQIRDLVVEEYRLKHCSKVHGEAVETRDRFRPHDHDGVEADAEVVLKDAGLSAIVRHARQIDRARRPGKQKPDGFFGLRRDAQPEGGVIARADWDDAHRQNGPIAGYQSIDDFMYGSIPAGRSHQLISFAGRAGRQLGGMARPLGREDVQLAMSSSQGVDHVGLFASSPSPRTRIDDGFNPHFFALHPLSNMLY